MSDPMVAEHDGKVYVASQSLDERLRKTELAMDAVANKMERLRFLVTMLSMIAAFLTMCVGAIFLVKRDVIIALLLSLM